MRNLSISFFLLGLSIAILSAQPFNDCSALQTSIDRATAGSTINVPSGVCPANLIIHKSLTLRGAGSKQTILKGVQPGRPVLYIESLLPIDVLVENLSLADAPKFSDAKDCAIFYPELICPSGLEVRGKARTALRQARVFGNTWVGVYILDESRALVQETEILDNGWGVYLAGNAHVTIEKSQVIHNRQVGIEAWASVIVKNSHISGNVDGVKLVLDQAQVLNNLITENANHGLLVTGSVSAEIRNNEITKNIGWGITAWLRDCGFIHDSFSGQISASENKVTDNKRGQVCLP